MACWLRFVEIAVVQFPRVAARFAHGFVELELHDEGREILDVPKIEGNVEYRSGVKVQRASPHRGLDALHGFPHAPKLPVIITGGNGAVINSPAPSVEEKCIREESDCVESLVH